MRAAGGGTHLAHEDVPSHGQGLRGRGAHGDLHQPGNLEGSRGLGGCRPGAPGRTEPGAGLPSKSPLRIPAQPLTYISPKRSLHLPVPDLHRWGLLTHRGGGGGKDSSVKCAGEPRYTHTLEVTPTQELRQGSEKPCTELVYSGQLPETI